VRPIVNPPLVRLKAADHAAFLVAGAACFAEDDIWW